MRPRKTNKTRTKRAYVRTAPKKDYEQLARSKHGAKLNVLRVYPRRVDGLWQWEPTKDTLQFGRVPKTYLNLSIQWLIHKLVKHRYLSKKSALAATADDIGPYTMIVNMCSGEPMYAISNS